MTGRQNCIAPLRDGMAVLGEMPEHLFICSDNCIHSDVRSKQTVAHKLRWNSDHKHILKINGCKVIFANKPDNLGQQLH